MDEKAMELLKVFDLDGEAQTTKASNLPYGKAAESWRSRRALATGSEASASG